MMQIIIADRKTHKTNTIVKLFLEHEPHKAAIVVDNESERTMLVQRIARGIDITQWLATADGAWVELMDKEDSWPLRRALDSNVYAFNADLSHKLRGKRYERVYIDNLDLIMMRFILDPITATITTED